MDINPKLQEVEQPSPKGKGRLLGWLAVGIAIVLLAVIIDPAQAGGWLMTTLMSIGKAVVGASVFYWVLRSFIHTRTHEIDKHIKPYWEMVLMISVAMVFGLGLGS